MPSDITIRWRGALDADSSTTYKIQADKATSGSFSTVVAAQASTSPYVPVSSTLNGAITATGTTIILADGSGFATGDYVQIDRETVRLGTKSTNTFTGSTRGIGASIPQAHSDQVAVYKVHESYLDAAVDFSTRKLIRYKVIRIQSGVESVAAEVLVANPTAPPSTDFCTVWGVYQDLTNDVQTSVSVTMDIAGVSDYIFSSGELIKQAQETTSTDNDGYWQFSVPKSVARTTNAAITITVNPGSAQKVYTLTTVPDQDFIHVQRTA